MTDYRNNTYTGRPDLVASKAEEIEGLAVIARTGNWADLVGEPVLPGVATAYQGTLAETALQPTGDGSGLRNMTKAQVGLGNVDNTSDADKPISTAMHAALATYNVNQSAGVDNTGATECAAALQSAIDYALEHKLIAIVSGTYKIGSTVVIKNNFDGKNGVFQVADGSYPAYAVEVSTGDASEPTGRLRGANIYLPQILSNKDISVSGWENQQTGVRLVNVDGNTIHFNHIRGFAVGVLLTAVNANGTQGNDIFPGWLDNNKVNLKISPAVGVDSAHLNWVNENRFYGGKFTHNSIEGQGVTDATHLLIEWPHKFYTDAPNNNTFYSPWLESDGTAPYQMFCWGRYNTLYSPRFERHEGSPASVAATVIYGANADGRYAQGNTIFYGYNSGIVVTNMSDGGVYAAGNSIFDPKSLRIDAIPSYDGAIRMKTSGNNTPVLEIVQYNGDVSTLHTAAHTAYNWRFNQNRLFGKQYADTGARLFLDADSGSIGSDTDASGTDFSTIPYFKGSSTAKTMTLYNAALDVLAPAGFVGQLVDARVGANGEFRVDQAGNVGINGALTNYGGASFASPAGNFVCSTADNAALSIQTRNVTVASQPALKLWTGTLSNSSGEGAGAIVAPTINQSGAASSVLFKIAPTVTSAGSGSQKWLAVWNNAGGSETWSVDRNGYVSGAVGSPVASATTITPSAPVFHVTGTTQINTINLPYAGFTGSIKIVPDAVFTTGTTGNIGLATTGVVGKVLELTYDGTKWYPNY